MMSAGLRDTIALARVRSSPASAFRVNRSRLIETDDPFALGEALRLIEPGKTASPPASFLPAGGKRDVLRLALRELHRAAPAADRHHRATRRSAVRRGRDRRCGLHAVPRLASRPARPARSSDDPDRPMLRFAEDACVQCGLCKATCPEKVISLVPQLDFRAATATRVLKQEEPFPCIRCGKPFGVKSTIERVIAKLEGKHWMYQSRRHASRPDQDVRRLPRRRASLRRTSIPMRRRRGRGCAPPTTTCASARTSRRRDSVGRARSRNLTRASRSSARPMRCSGILVPGV